MKKLIFVCLISISVCCNLFSQNKLGFGLYLGTSRTSLTDVDGLASEMSDTLSLTTGKDFPISAEPRSFLFYGGGFVSYSLANWLSLQGGVGYAPKGEKFTGECYLSTNLNLTSEVLVLESKIKLAYIEFPISVQLSTKSKTKVNKTYFYANLGVSPAVKVISKTDASVQLVERGFDNAGVTEDILDTEYNEATLDGIKGFDIGMFCSLGVCKTSVFMDLKFDHGLTNINEDDTDSYMYNKNNMIALSLGVKF